MRRHYDSLFRAFTIAFIVLQCPAASAKDDNDVRVLPPLVRLVSSPAELREKCPTEGKYDACTRMIGYRLDAVCARTNGGWTIDATATFQPYMFMQKLRYVTHENDHVQDIRRSIERHVAGLESLQFATADACEARVLRERGGFGPLMSAFALESNLTRHPQLRIVARK